MKIRIAALALAFSAMVAPAAAATVSIIGLQVDRSNGLQVHALENGNFLGLWRFNNREGINPGAGAVTIESMDDILDGFIQGRENIVQFYNGANPVNENADEFDVLTYSFTIANNARLPSSLWIEWTPLANNAPLIYRQPNWNEDRPNRNLARMNSRRITAEGDPLAVVPVPAALPLLLAGLGALGFMARRRKAA